MTFHHFNSEVLLVSESVDSETFFIDLINYSFRFEVLYDNYFLSFCNSNRGKFGLPIVCRKRTKFVSECDFDIVSITGFNQNHRDIWS